VTNNVALLSVLPAEAVQECSPPPFELLIVADASKFGHNAFANIAPLSAIDVLVTDASPPADRSQALSLAKAEVIVALPPRIPSFAGAGSSRTT
jgi:hypothetical protein